MNPLQIDAASESDAQTYAHAMRQLPVHTEDREPHLERVMEQIASSHELWNTLQEKDSTE
jgi:hypothetical protein